MASYEFARVGLPATGVLQVFADPWRVDDGDLVPHRVVLLPPTSLRDQAMPRPRGVRPVGPARLRSTDTMATLPHEQDVAEGVDWGPGEVFDYRVLKQLLERDPFLRNAQVEFAGGPGTPVRADYRPTVPQTRLGGHPLPPRQLLEPALTELGAPAEEVFVLLDTPLGEAEALALEADRPRLVVLNRSAEVACGELGRTVAMRYFGPGQPLPYGGQAASSNSTHNG